MAASEDNLRYPNMLNEQYDTFIALHRHGLRADRAGAPGVSRTCTASSTPNSRKWRGIVATDLPALNALLHQQGVPAIGGFPAP